MARRVRTVVVGMETPRTRCEASFRPGRPHPRSHWRRRPRRPSRDKRRFHTTNSNPRGRKRRGLRRRPPLGCLEAAAAVVAVTEIAIAAVAAATLPSRPPVVTRRQVRGQPRRPQRQLEEHRPRCPLPPPLPSPSQRQRHPPAAPSPPPRGRHPQRPPRKLRRRRRRGGRAAAPSTRFWCG